MARNSDPSAAVTPALPPVTFVILAFNQKAFIDHAIDAAFAQDYPNLQVLLSDDGSQDGTFEIMQARAVTYRGPHRVRAIRTARNFGLVHHFCFAAAAADGELVVASAADDMSLPHRVSTLVKYWIARRPAVIYSAWELTDMQGRFLRHDQSANTRKFDCADYFPDREATIAFGCAAAYSREFLKTVPVPAKPIWAEDYFLSLVALTTGEAIEYVDEPLVSYRQNQQAMRNFAVGGADALAYERREMIFFDGLVVLTGAFADIVDNGRPVARTRIRRDMITRDIEWYSYRADWATRSFFARVRFTATLRSKERLRWALPRVVGIKYFIMAKQMAGKLIAKSR